MRCEPERACVGFGDALPTAAYPFQRLQCDTLRRKTSVYKFSISPAHMNSMLLDIVGRIQANSSISDLGAAEMPFVVCQKYTAT